MSKYTLIVYVLLFSLIVSNLHSQEQAEAKIELSKKTFGLNIGTGLFQNITMSLTNFQQEILTTSDNLIPINFKANFSYYFTPKLAIRFSSGYGFAQQKDLSKFDYSKIHLKETITRDESKFSVTGFPAEVAMIFQTPIDVRANTFLHFGIGLGYYIYNYKAEGTAREVDAETNIQQWEENYSNPAMTLSGGAQFFVLGFDINIGRNVGATLEVAKAGWSRMRLTRDIVIQQIESGEVEYENKYGYLQQDYLVKNGFDDLAVSLGIFWQL